MRIFDISPQHAQGDAGQDQKGERRGAGEERGSIHAGSCVMP